MAFWRSSEALAPQALTGLLAFTLVACGGRYSSGGESSGSAGTASGGTSLGQGGRTSGTGGAAAGGSGVAGGVVGMAGAPVGAGGTLVGTAGTATGMGGANIGVPVDTRVSCQRYCDALARACPERASNCLTSCFADQSGSRCEETLREGYDCIAAAASGTGSCAAASSVAGKLCGAFDLKPPTCEDRCDVEITFDDPECHAIYGCGARAAEIYCGEESGSVRCSCVVRGAAVAELMTPAQSARDACLSGELKTICLSYAAP